jgi:flagellar biosynthetic protein FlhB
MASGDAGDKTEKPTPKRKREAREKGQIAKSPDLAVWAGMLATILLLQLTVKRGITVMHDVIEEGAVVVAHPDEAAAMHYASGSLLKAISIAAPMLIGMMLIGTAVNVAQVGFKPTAKKLKPDFSRLNPFKGFKRMVGAQAWWELAKAVAKTAMLVVVAFPVMTNALHGLTNATDGTMIGIASQTATSALTLVRNVSIAGLIIAAADYAYQWRRVNKQLRMSRQELREEMRQQEGNPDVRRAIRSRAHAISRNRMISAVSAADVIVVNPTHYAVALKYEAERGAPQVVAKGAGEIAAGIRAAGERNGVPIVHEPVLTRTLYRSCEIGQLVPVELYEVVAQVLAFVFGLRSRGRAEGYHEFPHPAVL